jgi:hypothetical protein
MAEKTPKPNGGAPEVPPAPTPFDDTEFFTSEGVTEDEERDAIRARARVIRYVDWRKKREEEMSQPERKPRKKWYKNE